MDEDEGEDQELELATCRKVKQNFVICFKWQVVRRTLATRRLPPRVVLVHVHVHVSRPCSSSFHSTVHKVNFTTEIMLKRYMARQGFLANVSAFCHRFRGNCSRSYWKWH